MSETRISGRYAKSIIGLAQEKGVLEAVNNDMLLFQNTCAGSPELRNVLRNPIIKSHTKISILNKLFGDKINTMTSTFFEIISRKGREALLEDVAIAFHHQYNTLHSVEEATLISAVEVDEVTKQKFKDLLVKTTGKQVELSVKIKPDLIGGYILKVKDLEIDASMSSRLRDLRLSFSENPYVKEF